MTDAMLLSMDYPKATRRLRLRFGGGGRGVPARAARLSNRWDIVAGALSSDPANAQASGVDWFLDPSRTYTDYADMARREAARADGIDAVAICTPNHTHYDITSAFLKAGIDVICDKPLTTTIEDAQALVALQGETGLVVGVTYAFAFHAMVRQARHMVLSGQVGTVRQVHVEYMQEGSCLEPQAPSKTAAWRQDTRKVGRASAVSDMMDHAFLLSTYVTGQVITELNMF